MIIIMIICVCVGFIIAQYEPMPRLLKYFGYEPQEHESEEQESEEQATEPAPVIMSNTLHVTIFPKQKKGRQYKYYQETTKRLECDLVTYKDGVLYCHPKDSVLEEEFNIKDIDELII